MIFTCFALEAQTAMSNAGALLSIKDGGYVSLHGDYHATDSARINSTDTVFVFGNWINNSQARGFDSLQGGYTIFIGDTQYIGGNTVTRFMHLELRDSVITIGQIDVGVDSTLNLNNKELSMDTNVVTVYNQQTTAILADSGFVSSLENGGLARNTGAIDTYWFPVGSNLGTPRYRPIDIKPTSSRSKIYTVRMANTDPTTEGFDRNQREATICVVNENYYHRIWATTPSPQNLPTADITFYFEPTDGDFEDVAHWQNVPQWEIADSSNTLTTGTPFNTLVLPAWSDFTERAFALANESEPFWVEGDNELCLGDTIELIADDLFNTYEYYINGQLVQDSTSNILVTDYLEDFDSLFVIGVDTTCIAYSYPLEFTVFEVPEADAGEDTTVYFGADVELTASGGLDYYWTPDTNVVCPNCQTTIANVNEDTRFDVYVYNQYGCVAWDSVWIYTDGEIDPEAVLNIPNAITPNGDAVNEFWNIRGIELYPDNEAVIVNRWGDEIFRSNGPYQNDFDGKYNGTPVPAGTYYYVLKLNDIDEVLTGPLTIIR